MTTDTLPGSLRETLTVFDEWEPGVPATTNEVTERLDVGRRSTYERLERLVEQGYLRTKKVGARGRVWWRSPSPKDATKPGDSRPPVRPDVEFRTLVDAVEEYAIFRLDAEGHVRTWNPGAENVKGYESDEILGEHFSTFYTQTDRAAGVPERNLETAAEEGEIEAEGWRVHADGSRFWANVTITAIRGDAGELRGFAKVTRDMTERREREQRLRKERAFTQSIIDNQRDLVYAFDGEGSILRWNDRLREVTGHTDAEIEAMSPDDFIADEAADELAAALGRVLEHGESVTVELPLVTADGHRIPYEFTGGALTNDDGEIVGFTGVGRDISDRKARMQRLERQRDDLKAELDEVFDRIDDAVYALDEEWRFTYINDRAEELFGITEAELIGRNIWETLSDALDRTHRERFERAMEDQVPVTFEEYAAAAGVWLEVTLYPSETGLSSYFRDITERKEHEHELEQYETIVSTMRDGVYVLNDDFEFVEVNDAYVEMTGYSREELLGRHCSLVVDDEVSAQSARQVEEILNDNIEGGSLEADIHRKDGTRLRAESSFTAISTEPGDGTKKIGVVRDVSDRVARERELKRQHEQLQALNNLNEVASEITGSVIDQSTREEIEATVCERLADSESYLFAWIGDVDTATQAVNLRTEAGVEGYLDEITISVDPDDERSGGATGRALRTGETQVTHDIRTDSRYGPWREHIERYGFRSSAAIPIVHEGTTYGVINVYADRPYAFDGQELEVITQLGEVVGHAIAAAERKQALMSDELVELEYQIRDVFTALDIPDETCGTITLDHAVPVGDGEFLVYGTVTPDAIETLTSITDTLPHWQDLTIRSEGDPTSFELRLTDPPVLSTVASLGGSVEEAVIEDGDYQMTIHFAPGVDVRRVSDAIEAAYPTVEMLRRRQISRGRDDPARFQRRLLGELTDGQQTALETAYYAGFFEWPRETSGEAVAESIGVAPPTFHEHLRKAERKVFAAVFSSARLRASSPS